MVVLAVLLVALVCGVLAGHALWTSTTPLQSTTTVASAPGAPAEAATLAQRTDPALVDIAVIDSYAGYEGAGSGIVLTAGGDVLTANHVIEGATTIRVYDVGNEKTYAATVLGYDRSADVALLHLAGAAGLHTVRVGSAAAERVGQGVVVVGNAEGRGGTPSYSGGSVTGTDQTITAVDEATGTVEHLGGLLETNASVVPGDSGGALVSSDGLVVGMITAGSQGFELAPSASAGYAIPDTTTTPLVGQVEAGRASADVHIGPTAFLGIDVETSTTSVAGVEVAAVLGDTPASAAGLERGDVLTTLAGEPVSSTDALSRVILSLKPGTSVAVRYVDPAGAQHAITVHLVAGPAQ